MRAAVKAVELTPQVEVDPEVAHELLWPSGKLSPSVTSRDKSASMRQFMQDVVSELIQQQETTGQPTASDLQWLGWDAWVQFDPTEQKRC